MPTAHIDYTVAHSRLNPSEVLSSPDNVISTPLGLSIVEIQGELNLPTNPPSLTTTNTEYLSQFIKVDEIYDAVKCGQLEFDPLDTTKVTLYIAKSQRLIGKIVNLDPPLGILKVPMGDGQDGMEIVDVVTKKMIFTQRPLPIM